MSRLRADIPIMAGAPAGTFVIPNTRRATTNITLEYYDGSYHTVAYDEYETAWKSGFFIRRSTDNDGNTVDWSASEAYPFVWSGYVVSPNAGLTTVTREPIEWYQETNPAPPIDSEGRVNLEFGYDEFFPDMMAASLRILAGANIDGISFVSLPFEETRRATINAASIGTDVTVITARANPDSLTAGGNAILSALNGSTNEIVMGIINTPDERYAHVMGDNVKGLTVSDSGGAPQISDGAGIDLEGKILRLRTSKTPSSASATGNAGEWCWDSGFLYVCVASNTWQRVAHATW